MGVNYFSRFPPAPNAIAASALIARLIFISHHKKPISEPALTMVGIYTTKPPFLPRGPRQIAERFCSDPFFYIFMGNFGLFSMFPFPTKGESRQDLLEYLCGPDYVQDSLCKLTPAQSQKQPQQDAPHVARTRLYVIKGGKHE